MDVGKYEFIRMPQKETWGDIDSGIDVISNIKYPGNAWKII